MTEFVSVGGGKALDRGGGGVGLFDLRVVGGSGDLLEAGVRQRGGETLAGGGRGDAVVLAPQAQRRACDPVQPMYQGRVVHIGLPAIERRRLAVACDRQRLAVVELAVI